MEMEHVEFVKGKVDWRGRTAMKHKHGGFHASLLPLALFGFEAVASFALAVNMVTYFGGVMHFHLADAANQLTNFLGTSYILSILVAIAADAYIGRFKSVVFSAIIELLGIILLTIQAQTKSLLPPPCNPLNPNQLCEQVKGKGAAVLFVGLYLIAIGSAGTKAALPSHGADQFDEKDPREATQMSTYFNCFLLAACIGGAISLTIVVWIQDNKGWGWGWGFGISAIALFLGILVFIAGLPRYRIHVGQGTSVILEILQVYVAAIRNRKAQLPDNPGELYEINMDREAALHQEFLPHRDVMRFLDKAAIVQASQTNIDNPETPSPWKLCRVTQVENAKIILSILPIFCCTITMSLCLAQLQTFTIEQGVTMDTRITTSFSIPPASIPIFPIVFLIISLPTYDKLCVPFIRKYTGIPTGITHLQRIGCGLMLSSLSMAVAAIVEVKRKQVARDHNMVDSVPIFEPPLPISVFWLAFQYSIYGIADMFTYVGLLEFFYSQAPKELKALSSCFLWSSMAIGYFLSTIMVKIVNAATENVTASKGWLGGNNLNRNHLDLFFWLLAIISFLNFCLYLVVAKRYKYRPQSHATRDEIGNGSEQIM